MTTNELNPANPTAAVPEEQQVMIEVKDLHKCFGKNEVLKGVNVKIRQSEVIVIIGPSGSGKSTLLRCLNLLEIPQSGHIFFQGKDILQKHKVTQTRAEIGMVFQQFNLFPHKTVLQNIMLAPVFVKEE